MPVVSVPSRPNGLPIASTFWPDQQAVGIAQAQGRQLASGVDLNQRQVVARVGPQHFRPVRFLIRKLDRQLRRAAHHVVIGENFSPAIDDETRTGAIFGIDLEKPILTVDARSDIHGGFAGRPVDVDIVLLVGGKRRSGGRGLGPQVAAGADLRQKMRNFQWLAEVTYTNPATSTAAHRNGRRTLMLRFSVTLGKRPASAAACPLYPRMYL